jgi:hypothetical protein
MHKLKFVQLGILLLGCVALGTVGCNDSPTGTNEQPSSPASPSGPQGPQGPGERPADQQKNPAAPAR